MYTGQVRLLYAIAEYALLMIQTRPNTKDKDT